MSGTLLRNSSYSTAILPAVFGVLIGAVVTTAGTSSTGIYERLPEYQLWRVVMIGQVAIYTSVAVFIWKVPSARASRPLRDVVGTSVSVALVVILPNLLVRGGQFPMALQRARMGFVIVTALIAVLLVFNRTAQVFRMYKQVKRPEEHMRLRREGRDLLTIAGLIVTLATLGSAALQISLAAMEQADPSYESFLSPSHVIAYGGYFTVLLFLFFAPVLVAERRSAARIAAAQSEKMVPEVEARLGLNASLAEQFGSAFGVLSPLLGALASRLLS